MNPNDPKVLSITDGDLELPEFCMTGRCLLAPDGSLNDIYGDRCFRDATAQEVEAALAHPVRGTATSILYNAKDWQDGRGFRVKLYEIPDGWRTVEVISRDRADEFMLSPRTFPSAVLMAGDWYECSRNRWWKGASFEHTVEEWIENVAMLINGLPDDKIITLCRVYC